MQVHILINRLKNMSPVTIIIDKRKKCGYPAPEECPSYDEHGHRCTDPNTACSYRQK